MKNIFMMDMTHNYYVDIAQQLIKNGGEIKVIGASRYAGYWPEKLDQFISTTKPKILLWEDFNLPERFYKIFDPDYSILSSDVFLKLSHYEKMFLMSTDRLSFFPISQIDRSRLFYRFIGHFYNILKKERIDAVVIFGIPHGLASIALFGLAKILKLDAIYIEWAGLSPNLSIIETELKPQRAYVKKQTELGLFVDEMGRNEVHKIVAKSILADCVWNPPKPKNRLKVLLHTIGSLLLKSPLKNYYSPEFFLNTGRRMRVSYIPSLLRYSTEVCRAVNYYERNASNKLPDKNSLVLFLHFQPEAVTMPQGGIFADQLLVIDLILAALPNGMNLYVKEHPFMFDQFAQDRHERSVDFYSYVLRDPRVHFVSKHVNSQTLLMNAGIVASTNGSISWEAMRTGNPCIIFGWSWFAACNSCFVVDSVDSLKQAIAAATRKNPKEVIDDVNKFLTEFEKRLINAAPYRFALDYVEEGFSYEKSVANLSRAIGASIDLPNLI
jgi:hypothetical protein